MFKFKIAHLFVVTTVCAVMIAFWSDVRAMRPDPDGPASFLVALAISILGIVTLVALVRAYVARKLVRRWAKSRWLILLRWFLGRRVLANELNRWGVELLERGESENAFEVMSKAIQSDPADAAFWVNRGATNYWLGNTGAAIDDLTRSLEINANVAHAHYNRGFAYLAVGDYRSALDDLMQVKCRTKADAGIAYTRGRCHEELFEWAAAADQYRLACMLDNAYAYAIGAIARLQSCCPEESMRNGEMAVDNARRACNLTDWKDWISLSVLAAAHAECGDFEAAVRVATEALDLAPESEKCERAARLEQFRQSQPHRLSNPEI